MGLRWVTYRHKHSLLLNRFGGHKAVYCKCTKIWLSGFHISTPRHLFSWWALPTKAMQPLWGRTHNVREGAKHGRLVFSLKRVLFLCQMLFSLVHEKNSCSIYFVTNHKMVAQLMKLSSTELDCLESLLCAQSGRTLSTVSCLATGESYYPLPIRRPSTRLSSYSALEFKWLPVYRCRPERTMDP